MYMSKYDHNFLIRICRLANLHINSQTRYVIVTGVRIKEICHEYVQKYVQKQKCLHVRAPSRTVSLHDLFKT